MDAKKYIEKHKFGYRPIGENLEYDNTKCKIGKNCCCLVSTFSEGKYIQAGFWFVSKNEVFNNITDSDKKIVIMIPEGNLYIDQEVYWTNKFFVTEIIDIDTFKDNLKIQDEIYNIKIDQGTQTEEGPNEILYKCKIFYK